MLKGPSKGEKGTFLSKLDLSPIHSAANQPWKKLLAGPLKKYE